jgi:hypothetical protein
MRSRVCRVGDTGDIDAAKPVKEGLEAEHVSALLAAADARPGDLLLLAAGPEATVNKCGRATPLAWSLQDRWHQRIAAMRTIAPSA